MNDRLNQQLATLSPEQRQLLRQRLTARQGTPADRIAARPAGVEAVPLSFAQQRLWVLDQLDPGNPAYNIPIAVRLRGSLETAALARALEALIQRHAVLRTRFRLSDGQPVQRIDPAAAVALTIDQAPDADQAAVEAWVRALYRQGFKLAEEPPIRARLLRIAPEEHVLALVAHHIAVDAWSIGVLIRELMSYYQGYARGAAYVALPELPIQYADFALWQHRNANGRAAGELDYWRRRLANPAVVELPTDRQRPAVQSFRGATERIDMPAALAERLRQLCHSEGCTLFMLGLAAFDVLLYRYSGQTDLLVGVPIAGRNRVELEPLIGLFVNTLVLRVSLDGGMPFRALLRHVREVSLDAFAHQDMPFERLVEELVPTRDPSRNPLFQVMIEQQNVPVPQLDMDGLSLAPVEFDWEVSKFDLNLVLLETPQGLRLDIQYSTDLFDAATIRRLLEHYRILLEGIVADPDAQVDDLPLMSAAERQRVLEEFNRTAPRRPLDRPAHRVIEDQVRRTPAAIAAVCGDGQLSYDALNRRANRLARRLRRLPLEARVGVFGERGLDMLVVLLATMKAGVAYTPLDPANPDARLRSILEDSGCTLIITQAALLERTRALAEQAAARPQVFCWEAAPGAPIAGDIRACADLPDDNLDLEAPPRALANIFYTSGSTGQPKGALIEHIGMLNHLWAKIDVFAIDERSRVAQSASHCFDISIWQFIAPLMVGGTTVVYGQEHVLDQALFVQAMGRDRITILETVPSLLQAMLETVERLDASGRPLELPGLAWLLSQAETLSVPLCRRWMRRFPHVRCVNAYGVTECSDDVTHHYIDALPDDDLARIPVGRPIPGFRVYVLDARLRPVPVGCPGQIALAGVGVGRGYQRDVARTASVFAPNPLAEAGAGPRTQDERGRLDPSRSPAGASLWSPEAVPSAERLYLTGDIGYWSADGSLQFLGRADSQIKINGLRVDLGEIEAALAQHLEVRRAAALVWRDPAGQPRLIGYVQSDRPLPRDELRGFLGARLPAHMLPSAYVQLDSFPINRNGKLDRRALPIPDDLSAQPDTPYVAPSTPLEQLIAEVWAEVLGTARISIDTSFFELGGTSLSILRAHTLLCRRLGRELPVVELFQHPTVAALASHLSSAAPEADSAIDRSRSIAARRKQRLANRNND